MLWVSSSRMTRTGARDRVVGSLNLNRVTTWRARSAASCPVQPEHLTLPVQLHRPSMVPFTVTPGQAASPKIAQPPAAEHALDRCPCASVLAHVAVAHVDAGVEAREVHFDADQQRLAERLGSRRTSPETCCVRPVTVSMAPWIRTRLGSRCRVDPVGGRLPGEAVQATSSRASHRHVAWRPPCSGRPVPAQ